jgi:8-oxo-dGTP pyrophosphatase MutT (NUDIX family)
MITKSSAGALIFYKEENTPIFLLLKYTNYWGFVKGLIEKGEEERSTIRREAIEEANLSHLNFLEGFRENISYFFRAPEGMISKTVVFLLAEVTKEAAAGVKISHEHLDFKWAGFNEAMSLVKHKNEKDLLTKAREFIKTALKQKKLT